MEKSKNTVILCGILLSYFLYKWVQILCFWTLFIVLSLSKNTVLLTLKTFIYGGYKLNESVSVSKKFVTRSSFLLPLGCAERNISQKLPLL
jgi:hypothetical protein